MAQENYVIFSQRAFNAIVSEVVDKHPVETGGILIGHVLNNGAWVVLESIPPGYSSIHKTAYFEYNEVFVNYLSNVIAKQYKGNIQLLGLWHRHPGSMDTFSSTDDETNFKFAKDNVMGAISGLVNCDPTMRITMYHVDQKGHYQNIEWYLDDGTIIPEELLALNYTKEEDLPTFNSRDNIGFERSVDNVQANQMSEPYTIRMAVNDMKQIIRRLITDK
ncbi:MAG: Mov34/MPN/PAD-1 family protein [Paludibacteraceae bacterium]|nr:Mov34/MPN/PAD-1 family protein [Paludibacteraceae bacterium]